MSRNLELFFSYVNSPLIMIFGIKIVELLLFLINGSQLVNILPTELEQLVY